MKTQDIHITGGGPVGLIAAILHAEAGYNVTVSEKRTNDRRTYIHSAPPKAIFLQYLKALEANDETEIKKRNSKNGQNSGAKKILINDILERMRYDTEFLVQIKEMQNILETYIAKFHPDIQIITGIKSFSVSFDKEVSKMIMHYQTDDLSSSFAFDREICAAGGSLEYYINFLKLFPEFIEFSAEEIVKLIITEYELQDKSDHAAVMMTHLGTRDSKPIENNEYDRQEAYNALKDIGYEHPPSFRVIDIMGKRNDFLQPDPQDLIVIVNLPGKNKFLVVGKLPDNLKTREDLEKWASIPLKYKFPNSNFAFGECNFTIDDQGERRLQKLDDLIKEAKTSEGKEYWKIQREKFEDKINSLKKNDPERLERKNIKDKRSSIFKVVCRHQTHPFIMMPNGNLMVSVGDAYLSSNYTRGNGVPFGIEAVKSLLEVFPSPEAPVNENTTSRLACSFTQLLNNELNERKSSFTKKSAEAFEEKQKAHSLGSGTDNTKLTFLERR